ncbi:hypothetical protein HHK36_014341 [Tetracentron sinense]|uniref:Uncharacterized protein n=1 Tax=Tetracentron sinense TaxID=13715 RepID=A0A835DF28_TETSI|nr:hypothetical protein HHK36_014341 [Tetracentron sinense]
MEEDGDAPPFWLQTSTTLRRAHHHHRRSFSLFLNPGVLIVLLPVAALFLVFFVVPSFLSFISQIFRPNLVKKSWDSVNLLLVLFAILCGVLCRRNDDGTSTDEANNISNVAEDHQVEKPNQSTPHHWYEYSDRGMYNSIQTSSSTVMGTGLKRNSSSYPDLRQESLWLSDEDRWRFFDDTQVKGYQLSGSDGLHHRRRQPEPHVDDSVIKNIPVDTFVVRRTESSSSYPPAPPPPPPRQPPAPPPPPPPPAVRPKPRRTFETQAHKKRGENPTSNDMEFKKTRRPPPPPSPPPPPPPPPRRAAFQKSEQKIGKSDTKKGSATKEIATVLASLYHQRKKKKKQKNKGSYESTLYSPISSSLHSGPPPSPPPPPPPPPPSVFHNLFSYKKGNKSKRIHSISATNPPPPPPPPPPPLVSSKQKTQNPPPSTSPKPPPPADTSRHRKPVAAGRPPLPTRINSFNEGDENLNSGWQSPLIPMPPPPPPFRMPDLKFVVRGDYAKIRSSHSSRSSSPDLDSVDLSSSKESTTTPGEMDGGDATPSVFCPSPDVNTKADTFIARFRAGLKLEKMNSVKEKQEMGNSGTSPNPI